MNLSKQLDDETAEVNYSSSSIRKIIQLILTNLLLIQNLTEEKNKSYRQLEKRIAREKQLMIAQQKMEVKKMLQVLFFVKTIDYKCWSSTIYFLYYFIRAKQVQNPPQYPREAKQQHQFTNGKMKGSVEFRMCRFPQFFLFFKGDCLTVWLYDTNPPSPRHLWFFFSVLILFGMLQ